MIMLSGLRFLGRYYYCMSLSHLRFSSSFDFASQTTKIHLFQQNANASRGQNKTREIEQNKKHTEKKRKADFSLGQAAKCALQSILYQIAERSRNQPIFNFANQSFHTKTSSQDLKGTSPYSKSH